MKKIGIGTLTLVVLCTTILTYVAVSAKFRYEVYAKDDYEYDTETFEKLSYVKRVLEKKYLREIDDDKLVEGAINGMLESLEEPLFIAIPVSKTIIRPYSIEYGFAKVSIIAPEVKIYEG